MLATSPASKRNATAALANLDFYLQTWADNVERADGPCRIHIIVVDNNPAALA